LGGGGGRLLETINVNPLQFVGYLFILLINVAGDLGPTMRAVLVGQLKI